MSDGMAQNSTIGNVSQPESCLPRRPVCYYRNFEYWPAVPAQNIFCCSYWIGRWISISVRDPGNISQSRWLTSANHFLRLYVSTDDPSHKLVTIVEYIIKFYAPIWFNIKCYDSIVYGSKLIFSLVNWCKSLDGGTRKIVLPVIQHNAYFAHSEDILLSVIADAGPKLRKLDYYRITKARNRK